MRKLNDLKLSKKAKAEVEEWLDEWVEHFIKLAKGREGNVIRADFEKMDLFFFTNCQDLMKNDAEHKAVEDDLKIRKRKRLVTFQLLIKYLKGEKLGKVLKCTHCGYEGEKMISTVNGHFRYCPNCGKIGLVGYDTTILQSAVDVVRKIESEENEK